jgi:hypothetical protein
MARPVVTRTPGGHSGYCAEIRALFPAFIADHCSAPQSSAVSCQIQSPVSAVPLSWHFFPPSLKPILQRKKAIATTTRWTMTEINYALHDT